MPIPSAKAADPGWLLSELTAAQILDANQAPEVLNEFLTAGFGSDAKGLAEFLVRAGLLTHYQAERTFTGDSQKLLVGPYLLLEPVGSGSLGQVFRALRRSDRSRFAIKVLPLRSLWNVLQAKRQVKVFADLPKHTAIIPFVDIDTSGGMHYLAWPFVEGETFEQLVQRVGPLQPVHAARFMAEVAEGLAICHQHDIAHGLLKPANLLLGPDRKAHILDLGIGAILAENIVDAESLLDTISTAHAVMGAVDCAAPETFLDPTARTPAGDAYSFGCILYYLLTAEFPFPEGNMVDKILAHQTQDPPSILNKNPAVSQELIELVSQLLKKRPDDRLVDMPTIRDALLAYVAENPDPGDAPAPPSEVMTARPSGTGNTQWSSDTGPFVVSPADASEDSVNFNVSDAPDVTTTPPPGRADTPVRKLELPELQKIDWTPTRSGIVKRPDVQIPPLPKSLRIGWFRRTRRKLFPWIKSDGPVQFSVFGPPALLPGQTARLQVFAHPPESFGSVRTLSRAFLPDTELLAAGYAKKRVSRGTVLGLFLTVSNAGVVRPLVSFIWAGQTQPESFDLYVPWECGSGLTSASITVGMNGIETARIPFEIVVRPRSGT